VALLFAKTEVFSLILLLHCAELIASSCQIMLEDLKTLVWC